MTGTIEKLIPCIRPNRSRAPFDSLHPADHTPASAVELTAHLTDVENARETVLADGTIQGVLEKDAAVGRMDGMLDKLGSPGSEMEKMSNKTLGKADTSIDFPAGTDMVLTLDQPLAVDSTSPPAAATEISPALAQAVQKTAC